ncbi:Hypothetical protein PBC10988_20180 [Planctomycetales bacterium 10988]|nr:Hypothetical protein PBC10988_20180 [Planctomycetales bacterium 10988]
MPPTILHLIAHCRPHSGLWATLSSCLQADAFAGQTVEVWSLEPVDESLKASFSSEIQWRTVSSRTLPEATLKRELRRQLQASSPAHLHTWGVEPTLLVGTSARIPQTRWTATLERPFPTTSWWNSWQDVLLQRHLDHLVVTSPIVEAKLKKQGWPQQKITVIPAGVEALGHKQDETARAERFAALELSPETKIIAAVGSQIKVNHFELLIGAMELISFVRDDAKLLLFGNGPERDALMRQAYVRDTSHAVYWIDDEAAWLNWLPDLSVFWLASRLREQPYSLLQALAAGIPVVANAMPGGREPLEHEQNSYLVFESNRSHFAQHGQRLLNSVELRQQLGQQGQKAVLSHFPLSRMLQGYQELGLFQPATSALRSAA